MEKNIEQYLRKKVIAKGGVCWKWVSPGTNGVPDRIVFMPNGLVFFVELKNGIKGKLSPSQKLTSKILSDLGTKVFYIKTKEEADSFLKLILIM